VGEPPDIIALLNKRLVDARCEAVAIAAAAAAAVSIVD